jgi:hypothetical protein
MPTRMKGKALPTTLPKVPCPDAAHRLQECACDQITDNQSTPPLGALLDLFHLMVLNSPVFLCIVFVVADEHLELPQLQETNRQRAWFRMAGTAQAASQQGMHAMKLSSSCDPDPPAIQWICQCVRGAGGLTTGLRGRAC